MKNYRNYMRVFIIYITSLMSRNTIFTSEVTMTMMFNIMRIDSFFTNMIVFLLLQP